MNYDRPLRGVLPDPGSQRVAEDGTIPGVHPLFSYTQPIYEDGILGRTPYQPTTNYPPEYPPQLATSNLSTLLLGNEEGGYGSTFLCFPPSVIHLNPHGLWNGSGGEQEPRGNVAQIPHSAAGPSRAMLPEGAGQLSYTDVYGLWNRSSHEWSDSGSPELSHTGYGIGDYISVDARGAPSRFNNYSSTSGDEPLENQFPVIHGRISLAPPLMHTRNPGLYSHPTVVYTTFPSRGLPAEARSDRHNLHTEERPPNHTQQRSDSAVISAGQSRETTDVLRYAEFLDPYNHDNRGVGGEGRFAELPPDFRSDELPSKPTRIQHRAKRITGPERAAPPQKRRRRRKPGGSQDSTAAEGNWIRQVPIRFWGVKLTDAVNPGYLGIRGHDERVLNYEGVGTAILCRLNFSGREIGVLKISTTNYKNIREPITKKKLASKVAQLVEDSIDKIRAATGCNDIAFENVVLTKLFHVSKASWQPEIWYEAPAPGFDPS